MGAQSSSEGSGAQETKQVLIKIEARRQSRCFDQLTASTEKGGATNALLALQGATKALLAWLV